MRGAEDGAREREPTEVNESSKYFHDDHSLLGEEDPPKCCASPEMGGTQVTECGKPSLRCSILQGFLKEGTSENRLKG